MLLLDEENYEMLQKAFDLSKHRLILKSIINKSTNGIIYVDSLKNPQTALVWDYGHYFFILGGKIDEDLYEDLRDILYNRLFNVAKEKGIILDYEFECFSTEAENSIQKVCSEYPIMLNLRRYYSIDLSKVKTINNDATFLSKNGFSLYKIDESFLSNNSGFEDYEEINKWIKENWTTTDEFLLKGFGMCIVKDKTIVSWSLTDYVVGNECEIGIETDEEFREQGLATYVVREVINYCREKQIKKVGWHCMDSNTASYKTAERVGFVKARDYNVYHGWFNFCDNNLVNGYYHLDTVKDFKKGAQFYEQAFKMLDDGHKDATSSYLLSQPIVKGWCHYNAACCWALTGNKDAAFSNLSKAINVGWSDFEILKNDERFVSLHSDERWESILNEV